MKLLMLNDEMLENTDTFYKSELLKMKSCLYRCDFSYIELICVQWMDILRQLLFYTVFLSSYLNCLLRTSSLLLLFLFMNYVIEIGLILSSWLYSYFSIELLENC